ncbi:unnamed protein product [Parnassius apollo]|uniref:(apollo) hypothetical protein n=1 Tax=Parnassius apollo TaxID=110799 RepID=A0A8S3WMD7_PARAO|nr:unnamed protein product [Parnassius apollo]
MLHLAVENVKKNRMSSRTAEKTFDIPRRTILNKVKECHNKNVGTPTRLSFQEEKSIQALIAAGEYGCPLTKLDLRLTVFEYLKKNNRENLFHGKPPGKDWVTSFLNRHAGELSVRSTQNIKTARAQKSAKDFLEYFQNLEETVRDVPPSNILNLDETNLSDDPGSSKCIFRRGVKYPERVLNSSKGAISLMFSAAANGTSLSPYVVYKAENLYSEWIQGGPRGARYNRTSSGWFDSTIFEDYFKNVVLTWAEGLSGKNSVNENDTIDDMIGNNDEYNLSTHTTDNQALPTFTEIDILDEKNGTLLSQITPTLCEINASSGTIMKPKNHDSCKENTNLLKTEKQKPKIVSCVTIPSTKRTSNIIYQSDYDKENIEARQTIAKQNDFYFYTEKSRNISTKAEKIKKTKTSNVKLRPKERIRKDFKVSKEKNMKGLKKKMKRRDSKSSNSDIDMSIHSDSDICGIVSDQDEPGSPVDAYDSNLSIGSENIVATITKTGPNLCLNEPLVPVTVDHFSEPGPSTSSTREEVSVEYKIGEYVLVRYFFTKKVDYYVGIILDKPKNGKLKVSFLRKVGKNDNSKFIKVKSPDIEVIDCKNIVKTAELLAINDAETDFVLADDDDYIYFDY